MRRNKLKVTERSYQSATSICRRHRQEGAGALCRGGAPLHVACFPEARTRSVKPGAVVTKLSDPTVKSIGVHRQPCKLQHVGLRNFHPCRRRPLQAFNEILGKEQQSHFQHFLKASFFFSLTATQASGLTSNGTRKGADSREVSQSISPPSRRERRH